MNLQRATVVKNEDGSLTVTFTQQWAAPLISTCRITLRFITVLISLLLFVHKQRWKSGHALYDVDTIVGVPERGDGEVGKHPTGSKVVETAEESTLIFPVTSECAGDVSVDCKYLILMQLQQIILLRSRLKQLYSVSKENPSLDDLKPPVKPEPNDNVTIESAPTEMAVSETLI